MKIFEEMEARGHEELIFNYFEDVDLKLIVGLHDTTPGRTLGGLRMTLHANESEGIKELLQLSQIMTHQCAIADIDSGGGSALLVGNPQFDKNEAYFRAAGRFIEGLKGRISIFPDMGTDIADFRHLQRETDRTIFGGELDDNTKPSADFTAMGVYWGLKACAKIAFGSTELSGKVFAVQGLGKVGKSLAGYLIEDGAELIVSDFIYDNIKEIEDTHRGITVVRPEKLLDCNFDFFVPCAAGSIIDDKILSSLTCRVIAGSAYNIFTEERLIEEAFRKNILYAPDFVISAGDLFLLDSNLKLGSIENAKDATRKIFDILLDILIRAEERNVPPFTIAIEDSRQRYKKIDQIKNILC
jgi:leucine dehydrogenase